MIDTYLSRLNHWTSRLAVLNTMRKSGKVRDEIATCKREITYNRNQIKALAISPKV